MKIKNILMPAIMFFASAVYASEQQNDLATKLQEMIDNANTTGNFKETRTALLKMKNISRGTAAEEVCQRALAKINSSPVNQIVKGYTHLDEEALNQITPQVLADAKALLIKKGMAELEAQARVRIIELRKKIQTCFEQADPLNEQEFLSYREEADRLEETLPKGPTLEELTTQFHGHFDRFKELTKK